MFRINSGGHCVELFADSFLFFNIDFSLYVHSHWMGIFLCESSRLNFSMSMIIYKCTESALLVKVHSIRDRAYLNIKVYIQTYMCVCARAYVSVCVCVCMRASVLRCV